jgi:alkylation response protein AidB-like acyl-CoA dehydrogenase
MDVTVESSEVPPEYEPFRGEVRAFVEEHAPQLRGNRGPQDDDEAAAVRAFVRAMRQRGYGMPRFHGADALSRDEQYKAQVVGEECMRVGAPLGMGNQTGIFAISMFGTDEQKAYYLPRAAALDDVWCQLFSEPDAGSDLAGLRTTAVRDGNTFVVNGSKIWSSYAQWADYGFLLARTDPEAEKHAGITGFVMPMDAPGLTISPLQQMTGDSDFNQVFFDDVVIPEQNIIGEINDGWRVARSTLDNERAGVGGVAGRPGMRRESPAARLVGLAHDTTVGGVTAAEHAAVRQEIAKLYSMSRIMQWMGFLVGTKARKGTITAGDAPAAKVLNSQHAMDVYEYALSLLGTRGVFSDMDDDREAWRWQDAFLYARANMIGGGTNEINRNVLAERGLGLPREPNLK